MKLTFVNFIFSFSNYTRTKCDYIALFFIDFLLSYHAQQLHIKIIIPLTKRRRSKVIDLTGWLEKQSVAKKTIVLKIKKAFESSRAAFQFDFG